MGVIPIKQVEAVLVFFGIEVRRILPTVDRFRYGIHLLMNETLPSNQMRIVL